MNTKSENLIVSAKMQQQIDTQKAHIEETKRRINAVDDLMKVDRLEVERNTYRKTELRKALRAVNGGFKGMETLRQARSDTLTHFTESGYEKFVADMNKAIIQLNNAVLPALTGIMDQQTFGEAKVENAKKLHKDLKAVASEFVIIATEYVNPDYKKGTTLGERLSKAYKAKREQVKDKATAKFGDLADSLAQAVRKIVADNLYLRDKMVNNSQAKGYVSDALFKSESILYDLYADAARASMNYTNARNNVLNGSRVLRLVRWILRNVFRFKSLMAKFDRAVNLRAIDYVEKHPEEFKNDDGTVNQSNGGNIYSTGPVSVQHSDHESNESDAEDDSVLDQGKDEAAAQHIDPPAPHNSEQSADGDIQDFESEFQRNAVTLK